MNGPDGGVFRRVLVGFDGSSEARRALLVAMALTIEIRGDVRVVLVVKPPVHVETRAERLEATTSEWSGLSAALDEAIGDRPVGVDISEEVVFADDPAAAIADYAARGGYDLIVVGVHGRERPTHRGLGRSLVGLLTSHPCPVLVV